MDKNKANVPKMRFPGFTDPWEQRKLGDVVDFLDEQRKPLEAGTRESGSYPYYGASGIIDYVEDYIFDEELILLSEDGANIIDRNYRVCFLACGRYWVNNHAHVLKAKKNYSNGFICEALERLNYEKYNTGTAQPKLNQEVCRNINIMIPELDEQEKIFTVLNNLDKLITLHQRKLNHLQDKKKSLLQKMFPKNGQNFPEIRFPGFTYPWEEHKLGEILKKNTVKNSDLEFHSDSIISVAQMKQATNVRDSSDQYMTTYNKIRIGEIAFEGHANKEFPNGRFVLNDFRDGIVSHIYDVYSAVEKYDCEFMKKYINNQNVMRRILINATSNARMMNSLNLKELLKQQLLLPCIEEQQKIGQFFKNLDNLITLHQRKLNHLQEQKKALLQQMFI
ncbi:restriction endonuclease subunit S [Clostridium sp. LBM24168]